MKKEPTERGLRKGRAIHPRRRREGPAAQAQTGVPGLVLGVCGPEGTKGYLPGTLKLLCRGSGDLGELSVQLAGRRGVPAGVGEDGDDVHVPDAAREEVPERLGQVRDVFGREGDLDGDAFRRCWMVSPESPEKGIQDRKAPRGAIVLCGGDAVEGDGDDDRPG